MAVDTDDLVLAQLRKLREGPGLTTDRLKQSGAVMSALATSDPVVARARLLEVIDGLDGAEHAAALKVDFGINLAALLRREPVSREHDLLGDRRSAYSQVVKRDVKTLGRWSDRALGEVRSQLLADTFTGHLYVVAAVKDLVVKGITLIQEDAEQSGGATKRRSFDYANPSTEPSIPALIYGYPRDWRPESLTLAVSFLGDYRPYEVWACVAKNFFEATFGRARRQLTSGDATATCRFDRPRADRLYVISWEWLPLRYEARVVSPPV
ncbi:hypothetical protein GCM10027289_16160 [Tsukamurella serpentis]